MSGIDRVALRARVEATQEMTDDEAEGVSKLATLMRGRREVTHTKIPGTDIGVVIRALMGSEKQECLGEANKRFADLGIPPEMRSYTDFEDEICWQILARVLRDPDDESKSIAKDVDELRDLMTIDERDVLMTEFLDLEERCNPDPALMPEIWHDQISATLKKKRTHSLDSLGELLNFGSRALASYMLTSAFQPSTLPTLKSGSSPDSSTISNQGQPAEAEAAERDAT